MSLFPPIARFSLAVLIVYVALPLYGGFCMMGGMKGLMAVAVGYITALFVYGELPRRSVAHFPHPPNRWLLGNLPEFISYGGYHEFYAKVTKDYGLVTSVVAGVIPQIIVADPDLIKEIGMTKFDSFRDRYTPAFQLRKSKGLLMTKGDQWHASRKTLNPSFNSIQLGVFASIISTHCDALVRRLDRIADKDKNGGPFAIDVLRLFGDLTMDVIGSTSFDSDFGLQEVDPPTQLSGETAEEESNEGKTTATSDDDSDTSTSEEKKNEEEPKSRRDKLVQAAQFIFANSKGPLGFGGNIQQVVTVLFPFLGPLYKVMYPVLQTSQGKEIFGHLNNLNSIMSEILEGKSEFSKNKNKGDSSETNGSSSSTKFSTSFIELLRKARDPDSGISLENDEIRDQLNLFVLAGYETTANTLSYLAFLVSQHPQVEARLLEEINRLAPERGQRLSFKDLASFTYTSWVVNEALRLYPPGAMLSREALCDVTIGGGEQQYHIKKGSSIVIPVYSIHRDERFWENPETFDPERFSPERRSTAADLTTNNKYAYLPFGIGPRNCIGQRFALEEIKLAVIALYRDHTFQLSTARTELPLKLRAGITLSPADGIWMTVHRRRKDVAL